MKKLTVLLKEMKALCDMYDDETFSEPVSEEKISKWEKENGATLCDELKEFYSFTDGMDLCIFFSTFNICKLEEIALKRGGVLGYENSEHYKKIGTFVGDGSVLCVDKKYNFCCAYHGMDIEEASLTFLIEEELEALKERIKDEDEELY